MDIGMPVMDGITATKEIRKAEKDNRWLPVPIVVVSAHVNNEQTIDDAVDAGCNDYVGKPYQFEELFKVMGKYCWEQEENR